MNYIKISLRNGHDLIYTQYLVHEHKIIGVVLPVPIEITHLDLEFVEEKDDPSSNTG